MDLDTKYDELAGGKAKGETEGVDKTATKEKKANVGAGPVASVPDGGVAGEAKQAKEHTGQGTEMGGATGGTSKMGDASDGNDNTGGH